MNLPDYLPALAVAVPLLGAFLTPLLSRVHAVVRNVWAIIIVLVTSGIVGVLLYKIIILKEGIQVYVFGASTQDTLNDIAQGIPIVRIFFEVDALGIYIGVLCSILMFVAVLYSYAFMKEETGLDKYYTLLLLLFAGMLGMVFTGDMFNFFVFLEITSIASCALIAFWVMKGESVEAAFKYIIISALGALMVLFAVALLYGQYNALNIAYLSSVIQHTFLDKIALIVLLVALAMKAGLVPMHMWLPDSYGCAPATVSVVLVGATLAGLYGMLRMVFTLYGGMLAEPFKLDLTGSMVIGWLLIGLAILSILVGVIMALIQTDFKRLIAFAAVAEIGYMVLGIGTALTTVGTAAFDVYGTFALKGGVFHIFNDALDVGLLFLVAGAVYYVTREHSLDRLGGLARDMKYTTVFFVIGFWAISGMPPLNGFASKLLIYESTFQLNPILSIIAILASILLLAVFVKVFYAVFMGPKLPQFNEVTEVPKSMLAGMLILSCIIIIFGLFPTLIIEHLVTPATEALLGYQQYITQIIGGI